MTITLQELIYVHQYLFPLPNKSYKLQNAMDEIETLIEKEIKELKVVKPTPQPNTQDEEIPF